MMLRHFTSSVVVVRAVLRNKGRYSHPSNGVSTKAGVTGSRLGTVVMKEERVKIKYKKKLFKRAEYNASEDIQFVGDRFIEKKKTPEFSEQPDKPFVACAVGCLVLPTKEADRKVFFQKKRPSFHTILTEEFNLPYWLLEEAENFFTDLDDECHYKDYSAKKRTRILGNFVISFAKAIPEGFDFDTVEDDTTGAETRKQFLAWLRRRDKMRKLATA